MAFYCATMLSMALELAAEDPAYEDIASKFFEHFVAIADAMNTLGGAGLWDELDGFYYDQLQLDGVNMPLRVRSIVGVIPLFAVEILDHETIEAAPGFRKRMEWFLRNRRDLARQISYMEMGGEAPLTFRLLAIPSREPRPRAALSARHQRISITVRRALAFCYSSRQAICTARGWRGAARGL